MEKWNDGTYFYRKNEIIYMLCDKYRKIHIGYLMGMIDETAIDCDSYNGFGYEYFLEYSQSYVFTRISMQITRLPECGESMIIKGWYTGVWDNRFHRDFEVSTEDGELLVTARMEHALFDPINRVALSTDELHLELPDPGTHKADVPDCKKILVEGELPVVGSKLARFTDIDDNEHMTYTSYVRAAINSLPENIRDGGYTKIVFNFVREVLEGDTIELRAGETPDGYVVQGFVGGKLRFCGEFS